MYIKGLKNKEIQKRLLITIGMLIFYAIGNTIPMPFIKREVIEAFLSQTQAFNLINAFTGDGLKQFSLFALSIYPYITASIVIQLLTYSIPSLNSLQHEGETGRKQIERYTMQLGLVLTVIQALGLMNGLFRGVVADSTWWKQAIIIGLMLIGQYILVKFGNYVTENGVGNGISLLIFAGIVQRTPKMLGDAISKYEGGFYTKEQIMISVVVFIIILLGVIIVGESMVNIPIQYGQRETKKVLYRTQKNVIPLKINMANVMPIIFASSLLALPQMISVFVGGKFKETIETWTNTATLQGVVFMSILTFFLIVLFTFFYTNLSLDLKGYINNLQAQGGFVPGVRPGKETLDYLTKLINKLNWLGSGFLGILAILPMLITYFFKIPVSFSGTSLIIVCSVAIETLAQLKSKIELKLYEMRG